LDSIIREFDGVFAKPKLDTLRGLLSVVVKLGRVRFDRVHKTHVTIRRNHFTGERGGVMARLPKAYESFKRSYPKIWQAYDRLGGAVHDGGPLDKKNRELLKLAMAIGARLEGAVHSHTRRALEAGARAEEIYHVVLLGLTTLGFPHTISALTWVEDDLKINQRRAKKRENR
jgi:AhpD family alkylhydroperoxidase